MLSVTDAFEQLGLKLGAVLDGGVRYEGQRMAQDLNRVAVPNPSDHSAKQKWAREIDRILSVHHRAA